MSPATLVPPVGCLIVSKRNTKTPSDFGHMLSRVQSCVSCSVSVAVASLLLQLLFGPSCLGSVSPVAKGRPYFVTYSPFISNISLRGV